MTEQIAGFDVEHLHGPVEISCTENELIVLCTVSNGLPWVKSFVEHYFSLGVKHIVLLDNDSTDGTVEACSRYDGVTVLCTKAPYKTHQLHMRRYLIDRFGNEGWSLFVDMDEHFDYPYSDIIPLDSLLGYLNSKAYTAVTAQMLDMFAESPLSVRKHKPVETWKAEHRFYDISDVKRINLPEEGDLLRRNVFESDEVAVRLRGGVRERVFGFSPFLTKYPLTFSDGTIQGRQRPHKIFNARIADLTCVLFHYKFYGLSLQGYWKTSIDMKDKENPQRRRVYEQYMESLEDDTDLQIKRESAKEISSVNELLENGFLVASEDYLSWVNAEEEGRLSLAAPESEPRALAEALLESRRQERPKTLKLGRLKHQLGDRDAKVQALEKQLHERRQEIDRLQTKLQNSRRNEQGLSRKLGRLEQQLEDVRNSRVWKLGENLRHIKLRLQGLRGSSR
jgi:Glycosyl transferase family 2